MFGVRKGRAVAMAVKAVILDLDGVIVSTDECHYRAWQRLADEEGLPFDRETNERLRGVSRRECLAIILERAARPYSEAEAQEMAARKNSYYGELISSLSAANLLPGARRLLEELRARGVLLAVASSSQNTPAILARIGLGDYFDARADGNDITHSKPHPEVFLLAAERIGVPPAECLVVEDAEVGVEGALAAGMRVLGVGSASRAERATLRAADLAGVSAEDLLGES
jgi:beta-phosphoglucomutase